ARSARRRSSALEDALPAPLCRAAALAARARAGRDLGDLHAVRSARVAAPGELVVAQGVRAQARAPRIMTSALLDRGTVLLALERKRVLDFVWIVTLAVEACALALLGWLGIAERGVATVGRSVLVYGAIFVLVADLSYRMKTPRAVHLSICANQCGGILFLLYLWALSGGSENPGALAFFAPP